jgi:hypothetical protein
MREGIPVALGSEAASARVPRSRSAPERLAPKFAGMPRFDPAGKPGIVVPAACDRLR